MVLPSLLTTAGSILLGYPTRMPNKSNTRTTTNNSVKTNNSTRRRRRGAVTPNNARRIRAQFQKPPMHPGPPLYKPKATRPRVIYNNKNVNIGNLTPNEINLMIKSLV
jgi:hypothetical protein